MILKETYRLNNGITIPKLGFGTWQIPNDTVSELVAEAIYTGYTHIDTAAAYGNEPGVGKGIRKSGADRRELFLTTKIPAEVKSYQEAKAMIQASLEKLETEYIDLMLIHAPKPWSEMGNQEGTRYEEENLAVWKAMEEAYQAGCLRAIGISNFNESDLQNILNHATVKPAVNQIQVNVTYCPLKLISFCQNLDILVMAYAPNATGRLVQNPDIAKIAAKYQVSVPQVCIRFCLQLGTLPLPKTTHTEYIHENAALDFVLSEEDMNMLKQMNTIV